MVQRRSGFTLIELLIFSAIFALIVGAFITILVEMVSLQSSQSSQNEVSQQGQALLQQIQYYVEQAKFVDMTLDTATSTLTLRENVLANDPTTFSLATGTLYLQQGATGTLQALTSPRVTVSSLSFARHFNVNSTSSAYGTESVTYSFTVSAQGGSQTYAQSFSSSATPLTPVPVVVLVQHSQTEQNSGTPAAISSTLPRATKSGDLLLALTANTNGATSSVSDALGNQWILAATSTYSAYSSTIGLFYAANASSGVDTTTATFASGGGKNPSLFLFEYRGASTSTAGLFDVSGSQTQVNTATPSTPSLNPYQSAPELLFAVDLLGGPTSVSGGPGSGFVMEASSTSGYSTQVFAEDTVQYISSPVSAPFALGSAASSTALLATFSGFTPSYNTGLVAYWNFEEGFGTTTYDWSGSGNNGRLTNFGATTSPAWTTGQVNNFALTFTGGNATMVRVTSSASLKPSSAVTLAAWVNVSSFVNYQKIIGLDYHGNGTWSAPYLSYDIADDQGGVHKAMFELSTAGTLHSLTGTTVLSAGRWYHIVGVYDGTRQAVYLNGNLEASSSLTGAIDYGTSNDLILGGDSAYYNAPEYFSGTMDGVRIYNRALSAAEVAALYASGH